MGKPYKVTEVVPPPIRRPIGACTERSKARKILLLADIHFPDNIDLGGVYDFIHDEKPDEIVFMGDFVNLTGISKYTKKTMEEGVYESAKELEGFKAAIYDRIRELAPKAKLTIIGGNHDSDRIRKAVKDLPSRSGLLDLERIFPKSKIIPYGEYYKVEGCDLYLTHGHWATEMHAKKELMALNRNVITGHMHTSQEYCRKSPVDERPVMGKSLPCLCERNPEYSYNIPNGWVQGFGIVYVEDGRFWEHTIKIVDGLFRWNGKLYG